MLAVSNSSRAQSEYYIPKPLLIPFHDQQQQLHTSIGVGGGYDINVSYAFADHFAAFSTFTINKGTRKRRSLFGDKYNIRKDDQSANFGLGYFHEIGGFINILETYVGYGTSKVNNYWYFPDDLSSGSNVTQARYGTLFAQLNVGRKSEKYETAVAARFSGSKYSQMQFYNTHPYSQGIKSKYDNLQGLTFEPAVCFAYQVKKIFVNFQLGAAIPLTKITVTQIDTHSFPDTTILVIHDRTETLTALFARFSLQYNFNFKRKQ